MAIQNTPPVPPPSLQTPTANNTPPSNPEENEYKKIKSFLLWCLGIIGGSIGIISAFAIYTSYNSIKDLKAEYQTAVTELKGDIKELKEEANRKVDESKNAAVAAKDEAIKVTGEVKIQSESFLNETKKYSQDELNRIQLSTNQLALDETKKELAAIFGTNKIQDLIQNQAVREVSSKLPVLIHDEIKDLPTVLYLGSQIEANGFLNQGGPAFGDLRRILDTTTSLFLKTVIIKNLQDYEQKQFKQLYSRKESIIEQFSYEFPDTLAYIDERKPLSENNRKALTDISKRLKDEDVAPYYVYVALKCLSYYSKRNFHIYEIEDFERWFRSLN